VVDAKFFEFTSLLDCGAYRVAVVGVEAEILAVGKELSYEFEHCEVFGWVGVLSPAFPVHADFEGFESHVVPNGDDVEHFLWGEFPAGSGAPVERDDGSCCAAHEGVYGFAGFLAEKIPECDVDDAYDVGWELVEAVFFALSEGLPMSVDVEWVFAYEGRFDDAFEVGLEYGGSSAGNDFVYSGAFSPAFDSGVGLDPDEGFSGFEWGGGDISDFQSG